MWEAVSKFILKNRVALLIVISSITVFMGIKALGIEISHGTNTNKILPVTDSNFINYENFRNEFGVDGNILVIGVKSPGLFNLNFYRDWKALGDSIKRMEGITEVLSIGKLYRLEKDTAERIFKMVPFPENLPNDNAEMDSIRQGIFDLPFYDGTLISNDKKSTLMAISFKGEFLNSKARLGIVHDIMTQADKIAKKNGVKFHYSGLPYIRTIITEKIAQEFYLFLALSVLISSLILLVFFRTWEAVVFPVIVVSIGVIWTLGLIGILGFKITFLTGLIAPLIVIIGVPNSVLMLNKFHVEYKKHNDKRRALLMMIQRIGFTTFIANLTTAVGFGVFAFTKSQILTEFGIVTAIMVMATYAIATIMVPILFSFAKHPSEKNTDHLENKWMKKFLSKIDYLVQNHRPSIYIVTFLLVIIGSYGLYNVESNGYMVDDLPQNDPVYVDLKFFEENFRGVLPFEIVIDTKKPRKATTSSTLRKVDQMQDMLLSYPAFANPLSLNQILKFSTQAFYNGNPSQFRLPRSQEMGFIMSYAGKSGDTDKLASSLMDSARQKLRVSMSISDLGSGIMNPLLDTLRLRVDSIFDPADYDVSFTGSAVLFVKGNNYLQKNLRESLFLAIFLISIIMLLLFRSGNPKLLLISLLPNLVPLLLTAGIMGFVGINLKPSTILIFSIAFGIASDQTIYFLTRYRQERKYHKKSIAETLSFIIQETGVSMVYTAIILFFGFGIFSASTFGGTASLGILISITLFMALMANLILLPTLVYTLESKLIKKEASESESQKLEEITVVRNDDNSASPI